MFVIMLKYIDIVFQLQKRYWKSKKSDKKTLNMIFVFYFRIRPTKEHQGPRHRNHTFSSGGKKINLLEFISFPFEEIEFNVWCSIELDIHVYNTIKNLTSFFSKSYRFYTRQYFFRLETLMLVFSEHFSGNIFKFCIYIWHFCVYIYKGMVIYYCSMFVGFEARAWRYSKISMSGKIFSTFFFGSSLKNSSKT